MSAEDPKPNFDEAQPTTPEEPAQELRDGELSKEALLEMVQQAEIQNPAPIVKEIEATQDFGSAQGFTQTTTEEPKFEMKTEESQPQRSEEVNPRLPDPDPGEDGGSVNASYNVSYVGDDGDNPGIVIAAGSYFWNNAFDLVSQTEGLEGQMAYFCLNFTSTAELDPDNPVTLEADNDIRPAIVLDPDENYVQKVNTPLAYVDLTDPDSPVVSQYRNGNVTLMLGVTDGMITLFPFFDGGSIPLTVPPA